MKAIPAFGRALAVLFAAACAETATPVQEIAPGSMLDSADQVAFDSRTLVTDAGLLRAEIFADTTFFLDENTRIEMRVVQAVFFNAQGAKDATLTSQRGIYLTRGSVLEAWGNVIVTSVDGRVLKSPMLRFDSRQNQVTSDSAFVMTDPDGKEMRGIGFDADPDLNVVRVRRLQSGRGGTVRLGTQ